MGTRKWDLDDSLKLVRAVQEEILKFGYTVTLGGSVLTKGSSDNDLDLFMMPTEGKVPKDETALLGWLQKLWGDPESIYTDEPIYRVKPKPGRPAVREQAFYIGGPEVAAQPQPWDLPPQVKAAPEIAQVPTTYKYRYRYYRVGGDQIDIFIV